MAVALHLLWGVGQADTAVSVMIIDRVVGVSSHFLIELDRVGFETHHRLVHPEIANLRWRVPGGSGGEFISFDKYNITPTFPCQMIKGRTTCYAATYDHDPSL